MSAALYWPVWLVFFPLVALTVHVFGGDNFWRTYGLLMFGSVVYLCVIRPLWERIWA